MSNVTTMKLRCGREFTKDANGQSVQSPFGGTYTPGHMKNGQFVSACWRGTVFVERGRNKGQTFHLTVWNGHRAEPGKGAADRMAKGVAPGTVFDADVIVDSFKRQLKDPFTGQILAFSNGEVIEQTLVGLKYVSDLYIGKDSTKHLQICFSRPLNVADFYSAISTCPSYADFEQRQAQMEQIWKARNEMPFQPGMPHYGFAIVQSLPADFQLMNNPPEGYQYSNTTTTTAPAITAPAVAGAGTMPSIPATGAGAVAAPTYTAAGTAGAATGTAVIAPPLV